MTTTDISADQIKQWEHDEYFAVDLRDLSAFQHGCIPGAIHRPYSELKEELARIDEEYRGEERREALQILWEDLEGMAGWLPETEQNLAADFLADRKILFYCARGNVSQEVAECFAEEGFEAYSLQGGYGAWVLSQYETPDEEDEEKVTCEDIEKSIRKKFHKQLFSRFAKAINEYEMLQPGDRVAVCISGGKDSMLMAKLFQELRRHNKFHFELVFLVMDPGYSPVNREVIEKNAELMQIPVVFFESDIFDAVYDVEKSPCYLCARMRRGHLYNKARELGCNKIALGHHYDDVIETILMGMLYGGQVQTMMPKLHSTNFPGMELIRPMYLIREDDIKRWRDYNHLYFLQCACHFTETCDSCDEEGTSASKRLEIKHLIQELKKTNPFVEYNIFRSVENVNLNTVIAYKQNGVVHRFTDQYDEICGDEEQQ
ncbi:MAG: ATP-binding protein [Clostridiales bacterium]|nr:ATP-binding protein [Clostridiales bacterium]